MFSKSDITRKKKHKRWTSNDSFVGKDLDKFVRNCEKLSHVDKQVSDHVMINMHPPDSKTLKKRKKSKKKEIVTAVTNTLQNTYKVPYLGDSTSEGTHKKKHKKYKSNDSSLDKELDEILNNYEKLSFIGKQVSDQVMINMNLPDSKTLKRKKRSKEEIIPYVTDRVQNTYKVPYLEGSKSNSTHKKKHKKNKSNDSSNSKHLSHFACDCEKLSCMEDQASDSVMKNMNSHHSTFLKKKARKGKEIITAVTDIVQDANEVPCFYDSKHDSKRKKKHKKYKNNDCLEDKDLDPLLNNCGKLPYEEIDLSGYDTIKKKKFIQDNQKHSTPVNQTRHTISHNSELAHLNNFSKIKQYKFVTAIQNGYDLNDTSDFNDNYIIKRDKFSLCTSNNEKSESDSSINTNDSPNIVKSKEPCKNTFEIIENIPEEDENFNENKSVDLDFTVDEEYLEENISEDLDFTEDEIDTSDLNDNYIIKRDKFSLCTSNNEKSESDSSINTNDSTNIVKSKEPCKNTFEIMENISKEEENFKENSSVELDLTEDDVDFEIPLLHARESVRNLSEEEKNELISQGVHIKAGKFTREEDAIILKNIEDFQKTYNILDISEVLGIGKLKKDFCSTKFLRAKHFYARLGKGLNDRTLISIYKRARRLIHPYKNKEKFQETEIRSLKFLRKVVNSKWIHIGDTLGRTEDKCLQAYRWHGKQISQGKWTKEEEEQLIAAIEKVSGGSDLSCDKLKGISWDEVATHIPTRNFSQCRMYWAYYLAWKPGALKQKWDKNCHKKLIAILKNEWYVENASEIDWLKVYESFVDVAPSHIFLQKRWLYLRSQIEGYKTLCYRDTVDILCKKYKITSNDRHTTFS